MKKNIKHKNPCSYDDICFSKLVELNPHLEEFVSRLDLVNENTGQLFRRVGVDKDYEFEWLFGKDGHDLIDLTKDIIKKDNYYSRMEIIAMIRDSKKLSFRTAKDFFNILVYERLIDEHKKGWYCLGCFMLSLDN